MRAVRMTLAYLAIAAVTVFVALLYFWLWCMELVSSTIERVMGIIETRWPNGVREALREWGGL